MLRFNASCAVRSFGRSAALFRCRCDMPGSFCQPPFGEGPRRHPSRIVISRTAVFCGALLDYNGVLVDDELVHLAAFRDVLRPLGIELSESEYWERYLGYDDAGAFRAILEAREHSATSERIVELIAAKRPLYLARARSELKAFPGAADLVRLLHTKCPIAIVSGALRDEIELGLSVLGVAHLVGCIISAEDTRASKPDPEGYLLGARWLAERVSPSAAARALVVEDSISGVEAAKSAGLTCLAVAHSYQPKQLRSAGADEVISSVSDASETLLESLYRRAYG